MSKGNRKQNLPHGFTKFRRLHVQRRREVRGLAAKVDVQPSIRLPEYGERPFQEEIRRWTDGGKMVLMATQVTHEGSDMEVYRVGKVIKENYKLMEAYDMTLEAAVTKAMWALGQTEDPDELRRLFYRTVNHDILLTPQGSEGSR